MFHFKTKQGVRNLMRDEAAKVIGDYPRWKVCVQIMTDAQAKAFRWKPFNLTKVWPHAEFPLIEVGELEVNRNPEHHFAEVEQAAFKPSAFVPGIGPSPDKMLQARLMSYADTHVHRLGVNHQQIPVNKPRCPGMNYIRDGQSALGGYGSAPNYWPNSIDSAPQPDASFADPSWKLGETIADRFAEARLGAQGDWADIQAACEAAAPDRPTGWLDGFFRYWVGERSVAMTVVPGAADAMVAFASQILPATASRSTFVQAAVGSGPRSIGTSGSTACCLLGNSSRRSPAPPGRAASGPKRRKRGRKPLPTCPSSRRAKAGKTSF